MQRKIVRAVFQKYIYSLKNVSAENKISIVFELFKVEILRKFLRYLKSQSPRILLQTNQNHFPYFLTRLTAYYKTVTNRK